jgi:hypothetical protein
MENKQKGIFALLAFAMVFAMLAFVLAANPDKGSVISPGPDNLAKDANNMTYGQCVSAEAKVKNDCYASIKTAYADCRNVSASKTECKNTYKKDLKQCKTVFKASKTECKKIKHNFLETTRHAFA